MNKKIKVLFLSLLAFLLIFILLYFSTIILLKSKYPTKYHDAVEQYAQEYSLEPSLVYSMIRSESGFSQYCISKAGAMGLMQLMPSTFEGLQKEEFGEVRLTDDNLLEADVNIKYGCRYLRDLLDYYGNNDMLALCAYNAGIGTVNRWFKDYADNNDVDIPYKETEQYVENVLESKKIYKRLYKI